jgi:hypothetical protein
MKRYHDNEEFIALFRHKLATLSDAAIKKLMSRGQFEVAGHSCDSDHNQCDDCYSGDTEFEMMNSSVGLGSVWRSVAEELGLPVHAEPPPVSSSSEAEEDDE